MLDQSSKTEQKLKEQLAMDHNDVPPPKGESVYLITLTGQGDTDIAVVDQVGWDWLTNKTQSMPDSVANRVAGRDTDELTTVQEVRENHHEGKQSWKNDRAFPLVAAYPSFWSVSVCNKYLQNNDLTSVDEYKGYIY